MNTYSIILFIVLTIGIVSLLMTIIYYKTKYDIIKYNTEILRNNLKNVINDKEVVFNNYIKLIDEPKPRLSYDEWCKLNNKPKGLYSTFYWNEYWEEILANEYLQHRLVNIANNSVKHCDNIEDTPKLLTGLLYAITNVDFDKISTFMTEHNWYWNDNKSIPTRVEMIRNIVSLTPGYSSGGFKVEYDANLPVDKCVTIIFDYNKN